MDCEDGSSSPDSVPAAAASEQVVIVRDVTEAGEEKTYMEHMLEAPSHDVVAAENAAYSEDSNTKSDITGDLEVDASKSSTKLSSKAPAASVEVATKMADDVVEETSAVQTSDFVHGEEPSPVVIFESEETLSEDPPDIRAPADVIDVLPSDDLPSAVDEAAPVDTEELSLDAGETCSEWPPLPTKEELEMCSVELKLYIEIKLYNDDGLAFVESEVTRPVHVNTSTLLHTTPVTTPVTASDISPATESGVLTKVGASEKVLAPATRLTDVDSMLHRFM